MLGADDVPREVDRALHHRIGPVIALVDRNRFDDAPRDRMLVRERLRHEFADEQAVLGLKRRRLEFAHFAQPPASP